MKARALIRYFLIAAMLCMSAASSFAATWYVKEASNGGNDAAAGTTWGTAFATVQKAVNVSAASGDVIYVANGQYVAQVVIVEKSITIEGGFSEGTPSQAFTEFKSPLFGTLINYSDATLLPAATVGTVIESNTFRPVVYVNTSSNTFVNNIYNITVNGDNQYANVPATNHLFCGIAYRNSNGTIGQSSKPVVVANVKGATVIDKKACFGILIFGRSQANVKYTSISDWQNAAIAVIGNSTSSLASTVAQQPIPTIENCKITGATSLSPISMTNHRAGILYANGARTYTRKNIFCSVENGGAGYGYGMYAYDGRAITFGDLTLKTNGNLVTGCEIGVGVTVTTTLIDPGTNYMIRNNNIVYNGNGAYDASATGAARFDHQPVSNGTLNLINNAWGNSAASTLFTTGTSVANAFWRIAAGDVINYSGALSSLNVLGDLNFVSNGASCNDLDYGFIDFPSLQQAVSGVAPCGTVQLASGTYTQTITIDKCLTITGNPSGECGDKPVVVGANAAIPTISIIPPAENVTIDGILVDKASGAGNYGYGILSRSSTNNPTGVWPANNSPRNVFIRNSCFRGFTNATPAAISTDEDGMLGSAGRFSGRTDLADYPSARDVDASYNNVLNFQTAISSIQDLLIDRNDSPNPAVDVRAQIIPPAIFVIPCGALIQPYIDAASPGGTLYITGACVYKENLNFNKEIYIDVSYTGRPLFSPVLYAVTDATVGAHTFSSTGCNVGWWADGSAPNKPPVHFGRGTSAAAPGPNPLMATYGTARPDYWIIPDAPANICLQTAHDSLATGGATMEFTGSGTTNYTVDFTINKILDLKIPTAGAVRGLNAGQTLQLNAGADVNRSGGSTLWDAPLVIVNNTSMALTGNTGAQSIQQGIRLATDCGVVNVNAGAGSYAAQTPIIDQLLHSINGISGTPSVTSVTLQGSGDCAACSGNLALINNVDVPLVVMNTATDCIQKALGTPGQQHIHGVGNLPAVGNRDGEIRFNTATYGNTANEAIIVDKNVRFTGVGGSVANSNTLTMRLGAYGTQIDGSSNYCNNTVNVEQTAGSGYTAIPDIQTGILLACSGQLVNVGSPGTATNWGGLSDTYNQDNTINKPLTVQARNNPTKCANNPTFVIDAATFWGQNAARDVLQLVRFQNFTAANPIFTFAAGVNNITLRGFDFSNIADGGAAGMIYAPGANNDVNVSNNWTNNSTESFIVSAAQATQRGNWAVECNRVTGNTNTPPSGTIVLSDHTGLTIQRNMIDYTAVTAGNDGVILDGMGGATANAFQRNVVQGVRFGGLYIRNSAANTAQNLTVTQNRIRNNNVNNAAGYGGINLTNPQNYTGNVFITNNFIDNNLTGIEMNVGGAGGNINHNFLTINFNSITGNTNAGLSFTNTGGTTTINARGNWWNYRSGPTNTYNPLNITVGTASAFGDFVTDNGPFGAGGNPNRIGYTPWDINGIDRSAGVDGYQNLNSDYLHRVIRTNSGGWLADHSHQIMTGSVMPWAASTDIITVIQGNPNWQSIQGAVDGFDAAGGDDWGDYFSENVVLKAATPGLIIRGATTYEYVGGVPVKYSTFLAGTNNTTAPAAGNPPAATVTGQDQNGIVLSSNNQRVQNFYIQGYSASNPAANAPFSGAAIRVPTGITGFFIEKDTINGSTNNGGSFGVVVEGAAYGTIGGSNTTGNIFGATTALSGSVGGDEGGIGIHYDANGGAMGIGNTVSYNVFGGLGSGTTGFEQAAIRFDNTSNIGSVVITNNAFRQTRDEAGNGSRPAQAAIFFNNLSSAAFGTVTIGGATTASANNFGTITAGEANKVDIWVNGATTNTVWTLNVESNNFRADDQTVNGVNYLIQDDRAAGTSGVFLRNVFGYNNGTTINSNSGNNTFSHAAILTSTPTMTWNYSSAITRQNTVKTIAGTQRIYRQIGTPMNAMDAISGNHVVEIRENAAFALGTLGQYYHETLTFPEVLSGGSHDNNYNLLLLGPTTAGVGANTVANITSPDGLTTALTSTGRQNRDIRGGITFHAASNGMYGAIPAGATNRGDVYLQGQDVGADVGYIRFMYGAAVGSQTEVIGKGTESGTANDNANKPTIIKAGLSDADDDAKALSDPNFRRTGVFLYGNGTEFTKPVEMPAPGLFGGEQITVYPNPAKNVGKLSVQFEIPTDATVKLSLYNSLGQKVAQMPAEDLKAGSYTNEVNVAGLPAGSYTLRMDYDVFTVSSQVQIIR